MALSLLSLGSSPFFSLCFHESLCPASGLRFQQWLLPVAGPESSMGWRSKCPTAWGEHVWRTSWRDLASKTGAALVVFLCGFEDKHLQVNQHEASGISSIFKLVIMEEICWKGRLSLLLIHGLSWTITDGWRFEVLANTSWYLFNTFQ